MTVAEVSARDVVPEAARLSFHRRIISFRIDMLPVDVVPLTERLDTHCLEQKSVLSHRRGGRGAGLLIVGFDKYSRRQF